MDSIKYPRKLLEPIRVFLSYQLKKLEKTRKKVEKEDPYKNLDREDVKASPDAEATEQVTHLESITLSTQLERKIIQTRKALSRIRIGSYGICESCGGMIDTDRLVIYPEATLCVSCEKKKEKEAKKNAA